MTFASAALLGLVQGLGEFLPISSSAHLVLVPWLLGWTYQGKAYDVALHWGTMIAACAYFWKDWAEMIRAGLSRQDSPKKSLFWGIVWATIPGGLAGLLLEKRVEAAPPAVIAAAMIAFGLLLGLSDKLGRRTKSMADLSLRSMLLIGMAQALAVVPGVSRSGITLTAGLFLGLRRDEAARFSFLLCVPIVIAAGILKLRHLGPVAAAGPFWLGIVVTTLVGLAAIRFLLAYLRERGTGLFVVYRVLLGLLCLAWAFR